MEFLIEGNCKMAMKSKYWRKDTWKNNYGKRLKIWEAKVVEKVKDTCKGEIKGLCDVRKLQKEYAPSKEWDGVVSLMESEE